MDVRRKLMDQLGGLELRWPRPVQHHQPAELPVHLPVLVQGYAEPIDLPWVALHAGRVLGASGRSVTPKHRLPLREVYGLAPTTKLALQFYVEDRVLQGLWRHSRSVIAQLAELGFDLVLAPNISVWRSDSRFGQITSAKIAFLLYHKMLEAGLPAIPDVGFSRFEPDGRLWAEWINSQPQLRAISIFCGGKRIHAERRSHQETAEDIALLHQAVRADVAFVLGGVHAPGRLADYRRAAPERQLAVCNGMAYALAQRRRLAAGTACGSVARSTRECFLRNCAFNDWLYARVLKQDESRQIQHDADPSDDDPSNSGVGREAA
jgi:hypothetical protein